MSQNGDEPIYVTVHEEPLAVTIAEPVFAVSVGEGLPGPPGPPGPEGPPGPTGPPGSSTSLWQYTFSAATSPPPTNSQVRANGTPPSASTLVWVHRNTLNALDVKPLLMLADAGQRLLTQDADDETCYALFDILAEPTDNGTYVTFSVALAETGTTPLTGNKPTLLVGVTGPPGPAGGPSIVAVPYTEWPPATTDPNTLYLRLAP